MLLLSLLLSLLSGLASPVEVKRPRGVSLTNHHFYDESRPFTCLDGSATIAFDRVNDDYCDCTDGSDEPGTAACPSGRFHCSNAGYRPQYLPSSRVNDGICDCCDATDEYNSGIVCENTCKEMGRKEREALKQMAEVAKEGFEIKKALIEEASKRKEEKQKKLTELQEGKKVVEEQVETLRSVKEAAEKPEKEAKDIHQKAWENQKAAERAARDEAKAEEAFHELDDDADGMVSITELQTHPELDTDGDGMLSETEAQTLLGNALQADVASFQDTVWAAIKEKYKAEGLVEVQHPSKTPVEEETDTQPDAHVDQLPPDKDYDEEDDEERETEEDGSDEMKVPSPRPSSDVKALEDELEKMLPYDEATQALIDAAQKAREQFEEAEKSLKEMEDSIRSLEKEISFAFGPHGEFSYLYGQCYELTTNEYIYRLCPFNRVSQKPKHSGSETSLGTWGSWIGPGDNKFSVMKYEHGTGCWQGPNRSTIVKLSCGKETVVLSTAEPSRCEYLMEFVTPAACHEPKDLNHDEL
ncbi:glucosidase 2 subunit beta [Rhineura floridana]|uniref:glucosidase 2 subunit beta n=1 Tax=Rhineura floridana TaxID=261503 RepID=UPI002AC88EEA|nr:glucosidase 2 subunit beta [Rhineura floridana]XP_061496339.1 glucosidase 2 subunit beta [Rhineura floridana]XP_061496349.1 glucosidase 2 subunit beta [Rhineura floridana]